MLTAERETFVAEQGDEREQLARFERLLTQVVANRPPAELVGPNGERMPLPHRLYEVLLRAAHELAAGNGIAIMPVGARLTTQQAADQLNISRPHLIKMLEAGEMPFEMVGTHRRVLLADVIAYKRYQADQRRIGLANLAQIAQESGMYDIPLGEDDED